MSNIPRVPNKEVYLFTNVPLGANQVKESLYINENEAWYDKDGLIRLFSMKFDDGAIGNFMLMPKNKPIPVKSEIIISEKILFNLVSSFKG